MIPRVASAGVGLPLLALAIWVGGPWFSVVVAVAATAGALELCQMLRRRGRRPATLMAEAWAVGLVAGAHFLVAGSSFLVILSAVPVAIVLVAILWLLAQHREVSRWADWGIMAGAAFSLGGLLAHATLLRGLDQGREWVFLAVLVTFAADTVAFFVGRAIGKKPLAPSISPGKTWEGAVGGLVAAVGASVALAPLFGLGATLVAALALGVLLGVVGQIGDLVESKLKRYAGVKDSGWLIPGHGGILDRLDSIVFNLAVVYHFVIWAVQ